MRLKMEKRIRRSLRLTRHHPVLEPYLLRATRRMKSIRFQVNFPFILTCVTYFLYECIDIVYYALICRSNCVDAWTFHDGTRKVALPK